MRLRSLYSFGSCSATTKGGEQCRARMIYANGLCKSHGGEGIPPEVEARSANAEIIKRWRAEKAERQRQAIIRRIATLRRKLECDSAGNG